ncbi:MAG: hypothetical protein ABJQ71_18950 [Roseibium sp.]
MSDDGSKKPFSLAARNPFQDDDKEPERIRDKDNVGHEPKPEFARHSAFNLAPAGMLGIRRSLPDNKVNGLIVENSEVVTGIHLTGYLEGNPDIRFEGEVATDQNRGGLNDGPINKLTVHDQDRVVAQYDGGWQVVPETEADHQVLDMAVTNLTDFGQELQQQHQQKNPDLEIEEDRFHEGELTDGFIEDRDNVTFMAKVETEDHPDGLNGGPITFLDLRENGLTVARYDHGWIREPQAQADRESVQKISETLETANRDFKPLVPPETGKDKGHDIDR